MIECPNCDGVHDHQGAVIEHLSCTRCGGAVVSVRRPTVVKGPWLCEHANENPNVCSCPRDCYCRRKTCEHKP
jgi:hypothetical protein